MTLGINIKKYIETKMAMRTHKFKLYLRRDIEQKMLVTLDLCRKNYNELLGLLNEQKKTDRGQFREQFLT